MPSLAEESDQSANQSAKTAELNSAQTKAIQFSIGEVTQPDVVVSSDQATLYFTALGHIFSLPTEGGKATQLSFGPYFDSSLALSPDGKKLAFASDRNTNSNSNIFVLTLETAELQQLTCDEWAQGLSWSADGSKLSYLTCTEQGLFAQYEFVAPTGLQTRIHQYDVASQRSQLITGKPGFIAMPFISLMDGWSGRPVSIWKTKNLPPASFLLCPNGALNHWPGSPLRLTGCSCTLW